MTLYAGETTRVKTKAKDFDGIELTDTDVVSAKVDIHRKSDNVALITNATMTWDSTHGYWFYDWDTGSVEAGAYRAKVELVGVIFSTWEYADIRLKANPT